MNFKKIFILILIMTIFLGIYSLFAKPFEQLYIFKNSQKSLKVVIENALSGTRGRYGIVIKNLKTGENYNLNEHQQFEAGSLYKLWVMALTFEQINQGVLKENQILTGDVKILNEKFGIDESQAELKTGTVEMTVSQALNQMISISHNYAALLLSEKLKNSQIAKFLKNQNFNESSISDSLDPPQTTPSDIALFYEKLYQGKLVDLKSSQKMIDLLKKQNLNDGISKNLDKDVAIAHKTGDIGWFKHDGGIVFAKDGDYIIVILSESNSPPAAQERIAQISKAVYEYFEKK